MYSQTTQTTMDCRKYPLHKSIRVESRNLERIKARTIKYGESVDDILTRLLDRLEQFEKVESEGRLQ